MRGADRAGRRRAVALVLTGVAVLLVVLGCGGPGVAPASPLPELGRVVPTSVRIDAIGVDEPDPVRLGIAADGSAEVPVDYARVGWFDNGESGPTVLLGHVDSRSGPAVFYRLRDLRPGDVVEVGRSDGTRGRYAVERSRQVGKDEFPTFDVFGAADGDVLRLVTCAGEFDRGARSYTDNLVVHARGL